MSNSKTILRKGFRMKKLLLLCAFVVSSLCAEAPKGYETYVTAFGGKILNDNNSYVMGIKGGGWRENFGVFLDISLFGDYENNGQAVVKEDTGTELAKEYIASFSNIDTPVNVSLMAAYRLQTDSVQPFIAVGPTVTYMKTFNTVTVSDKAVNNECNKFYFGASAEAGLLINFVETKYVGLNFEISGRASYFPYSNKFHVSANLLNKDIKKEFIYSAQIGLGLDF